MRTLSAAALAVLFSLTAQSKAQTGRAMTIDDLITAVRVTDPQLSPDGSRVIFVRTTTDPKTGDRNADIWSVPADGSGPAQAFTFDNPNFSQQSLRGNAVFRWEYRPGSVLYVAWTHSRFDQSPFGNLEFTRDREALFAAPPDNVFLVKASWWLTR